MKINVTIQKKREQEEKKAHKLVHDLVQKIDNEPKNYRHYYELATLLVEGKDYEQAEELLMKALGLFKDSGDDVIDTLKFGLGNVYYAAQEYDKAIKIFQEINDTKLQAEAYAMLAQSYMAKGDNKRAMVFALSAQSGKRDDPSINEMIGDNLLALGNFAQAGEFYDNVLKAEPQNGKANFNRGWWPWLTVRTSTSISRPPNKVIRTTSTVVSKSLKISKKKLFK